MAVLAPAGVDHLAHPVLAPGVERRIEPRQALVHLHLDAPEEREDARAKFAAGSVRLHPEAVVEIVNDDGSGRARTPVAGADAVEGLYVLHRLRIDLGQRQGHGKSVQRKVGAQFEATRRIGACHAHFHRRIAGNSNGLAFVEPLSRAVDQAEVSRRRLVVAHMQEHLVARPACAIVVQATDADVRNQEPGKCRLGEPGSEQCVEIDAKVGGRTVQIRRGEISPGVAAAQLRELRNVLDREQLRRYIRRDEAEDLIRNLEAVGEVVTDLPDVNVSTDPDDNLILAAAVAGRADMIVSGDRKHMLALGAVEGIPIVTARDAVRQLRGQQPR